MTQPVPPDVAKELRASPEAVMRFLPKGKSSDLHSQTSREFPHWAHYMVGILDNLRPYVFALGNLRIPPGFHQGYMSRTTSAK